MTIKISSATVKNRVFRTHVFGIGWDGEIFKDQIIFGLLTSVKIKKIQTKWDQIYGGCMKYEMVCLNY